MQRQSGGAGPVWRYFFAILLSAARSMSHSRAASLMLPWGHRESARYEAALYFAHCARLLFAQPVAVDAHAVALRANERRRAAQQVRRIAAAVASSAGACASVRGNQITARGGTFSVAILAVPICDFSNNQCLRSAAASIATNVTQPDVFLAARTLIVGGNRISGPKGPSMALLVPVGRYTVLGNITAGDIRVQNVPLADPWAALNREAP